MNAVHHEIGMKRIYDLLVFPKAKGPVVKAEFAADQKMQSAAVFFLQGARGLKIERNIDLVFGFAFDLYALLGIIIIYVFADPVIGNPFGKRRFDHIAYIAASVRGEFGVGVDIRQNHRFASQLLFPIIIMFFLPFVKRKAAKTEDPFAGPPSVFTCLREDQRS